MRRVEHVRALSGLLAVLFACSSNEGTSAGNTAGAAGTIAGVAGTTAGASPSAGNAGAGAGGSAQGGATPTGGGGAVAATGGTAQAGAAGAVGAGGPPMGGGAGGGSAGIAGMAGGPQGGGSFTLTSPAFDHVPGCSVETPRVCDVFPDENVSYMGNANVSPELRWTGAPAGTQSYALVLFDVTYGQAHWAMWNIPANLSMLAANVPKDTATPPVPAGARQANANFAPGGDGYFGPHIPCNVFQFVLVALSASSFSPMDPESAVLVWIELQGLGESVLGSATLTGRSNDYMMTCE